MHNETVVILGVPVDNLTMDEAMARIFSMIDAYASDGRPSQVATVNVDFLVNANAWLGRHIRHPELLDILRRADLVTADGMPIVWASRLLGSPLKERVTGADLVPRLAEEAATRGKSLFFLGGKGDVAERAADVLKQRHPNLAIAGIYAPFVHVEGEALMAAETEDQEIVDRINRARPDILLIGFGNPKQEIWFDRNRTRLRVPVAIGIGGTYEFIVGTVSRAPRWMQNSGLEWVYRLTQDPRRLIKRYMIGFFKFGFMIGPALLYYRYRAFLHKLPGRRLKREPRSAQAPRIGDFRVIHLPDRVDAAFIKDSGDLLEKNAVSTASTVLDFSRTSFMDSSGLGFAARLWKYATENGTGLYLTGLTPQVIHFLKLNRLWQLFSKNIHENLEVLLNDLKERQILSPFCCVVSEETPGFAVLKLSGRLDADQMSAVDMEGVIAAIGDRGCVLDCDGLDFVDSSGIVFFLKIQKALSLKDRACVLCNIHPTVFQMFRIAKLNHLFNITSDIEKARKAVQ
jgi:N-acetylglucosaminyldiphosphoundecaprenol N-acetyl-beta-D-mannosaminyltransferase